MDDIEKRLDELERKQKETEVKLNRIIDQLRNNNNRRPRIFGVGSGFNFEM